jgi:ribonuclease HI
VQKIQRPVYYASKVLAESKLQYPQVQKIIYEIWMAARKLKHYFQAHPITVVVSSGISEIINNREASGRIAGWAMEIQPHGLNYLPRPTIKSQALADFVAEWTENQPPLVEVPQQHWTLFFDGSLRRRGAGAGVMLVSLKGNKFQYVLQLHFDASNNAAEYESLLHGMRMALVLGVRYLCGFRDSKLIVGQVMKDMDCKEAKMEAYCQEVCKLEGRFGGFELYHIGRTHSEEADALANMASR